MFCLCSSVHSEAACESSAEWVGIFCAKLHTAGELLDKKYGEIGSESRTNFHEKSIAWYYGKILRDHRKQLKITRQELAEKVGTARSYIARVEKGESHDLRNVFRLLSLSNCSMIFTSSPKRTVKKPSSTPKLAFRRRRYFSSQSNLIYLSCCPYHSLI